MAEYLAPGVYVEETAFAPKAITGVETDTAAFVGPARYGPVVQTPPVIASLTEFERRYGDGRDLVFLPGPIHPNYTWYSVRAFFEEGGRHLHIARIYRPLGGGPYRPPAATLAKDRQAAMTAGRYNDGHGRAFFQPDSGDSGAALLFRARFPGEAGNLGIGLRFRHGPNRLGGTAASPQVTALSPHDIVLIDDHGGGNGLLARALFNHLRNTWSFQPASGVSIPLARLDPATRRIRILTVEVAVDAPNGGQPAWTGLPPDPLHAGAGGKDSLLARFARRPASDDTLLEQPFEILPGKGITSGLALIDLLARLTPGLAVGLLAPDNAQAMPGFECRLAGGHDGMLLDAVDYAGRSSPGRSGLKRLETLPDIAIVAAPAAPRDVIPHLIRHCERLRHRVAILDSGRGHDLARVRALAAAHPSGHAALYYPWLQGRDARTGQPIPLPPCGFLAGIYARTDRERGVWKSSANQPVRSALGVETAISQAQQDLLNPQGVNCLRVFPGCGLLVWGARTLSTDPEWKYISVRRHLCYLERSIEAGTRWAVFEPNGEPLWARMRAGVENFLHSEWRAGALLGDKPEEAYFVRCDRSTMTQSDLDNGRLVCLIGVAPIKPAEFILFRIGQWTADAAA